MYYIAHPVAPKVLRSLLTTLPTTQHHSTKQQCTSTYLAGTKGGSWGNLSRQRGDSEVYLPQHLWWAGLRQILQPHPLPPHSPLLPRQPLPLSRQPLPLPGAVAASVRWIVEAEISAVMAVHTHPIHTLAGYPPPPLCAASASPMAIHCHFFLTQACRWTQSPRCPQLHQPQHAIQMQNNRHTAHALYMGQWTL
jgi:hypothetical protein